MICNSHNPYQKESDNLPAEAIIRAVGGMSTVWTCATPELLRDVERPKIFADPVVDDKEWSLLYDAARSFIGTSDEEFDESIRHNTVLAALKSAFAGRRVEPLPLACHRVAKGSPYIQWHAADDVRHFSDDRYMLRSLSSQIFGDMFTHPNKLNESGTVRGVFKLITNTRCTRLITESHGDGNVTIRVAEVQDLYTAHLHGDEAPKANYLLSAKHFVVAAGN